MKEVETLLRAIQSISNHESEQGRRYYRIRDLIPAFTDRETLIRLLQVRLVLRIPGKGLMVWKVRALGLAERIAGQDFL